MGICSFGGFEKTSKHPWDCDFIAYEFPLNLSKNPCYNTKTPLSVYRPVIETFASTFKIYL
jgi:hypothetical protein